MTIPVEEGNRITIPDVWAQEMGLQGEVDLVRTAEGLLIRRSESESGGRVTWQQIFAHKLKPRVVNPESDDFELTGDDYLC